jgi:exoribonuclease R
VPRRPVRLASPGGALRETFSEIRAEIGVPEAFPADVLAEAERAATAPRAPETDRTDVPFVTIDPPTSLDLDQARPRPAAVWQLDVGTGGDLVDTHVERAIVASRAKLSYAEVQRSIDDASADASLALLPEIGRLLQDAERARGGASLGVLRQEVVPAGDGFELRFEAPLPVERWNAQISLLTGRAAAGLMLQAGVGVLRTMPPPDPGDGRPPFPTDARCHDGFRSGTGSGMRGSSCPEVAAAAASS